MNFNEYRSTLIEINNLQNTDGTYTFYYDETNNIRKLYLAGSGLNVEQDNNFVLAGILHRGLSHEVNYSTLFDKLNLHKNSNELKLKHIAKGSFLDMLKSSKLGGVLLWLHENNFYIHYSNLNILYWSIVDIIDSIIGESNHPYYMMYHMQIKSDFYEIALKNRKSFLQNLFDYNYPDVNKGRIHCFCQWLLSLVDENSEILPHFNLTILSQLFRESLSMEDLPFISGSHGKELISSFMIFYLRNLYLFKNSKHIFDEEHYVENEIFDFQLAESEIIFQNFNFVRSQDVKPIQISDVIAGFLGKYFTYLKNTDLEQVKIDRGKLNQQQKKTLEALKKLIDASDELSRGFFHTVSTEGEKIRGNLFLHGD